MKNILHNLETTHEDVLGSFPSNVRKPPRFANVQLNPNFKWSPNPYDSSASLPDYNYNRSQNTPNTTNGPTPQPPKVPTTVHINNPYAQTTGDSLPQVNHDYAIKWTKIKFTGLDDIFVFYNQLMNSMEPFGVYLIPLSQVKYQYSLCPTMVHNMEITERQKQIMGSALNQKLQSIEVVPMEYTKIQKIL